LIAIRKTSLLRQIDAIRTFITTPVGVFQTIDQMITTFRTANKESLKAITVKPLIRIGA